MTYYKKKARKYIILTCPWQTAQTVLGTKMTYNMKEKNEARSGYPYAIDLVTNSEKIRHRIEIKVT